MQVRNIILALSLFAAFSMVYAAPQYRLVSGTRGVIFSIENVQVEPEVQVELIDGNLSVNIKDATKDSLYSKTVVFPEGFWADSMASSHGEGVAQLMFYNFKLSIEDMQKKFNASRFLLLVSPMKSMEFDKVLFESDNGNAAVVTNYSISNRDGMEKLSFFGMNFDQARVARNDKGILVSFDNGLEKIEPITKLNAANLTDSVLFTVSPSGVPALQIYSNEDEGYLSLMEVTKNNLRILFVDNREKDKNSVALSDGNGFRSFVIDETIGSDSKVEEVASTDVAPTQTETEVAAVQESAPAADPSVILYLIKDNVNIRSTPSTKNSDNIIGKYPFGTKMVSNHKEGAWYSVVINGSVNGWVYKTLVEDSASITETQWDAIYNHQAKANNTPVLDEFNSPGTDPLLADNKNDVFSLDSSNAKAEIADSSSLAKPEVDKKEEVVIKQYKKYGRDPFLPLTNTDFLKPKLPKIDMINLVGIIYDPQQGLALFEEIVDGEIVSFSMRVGEKVENGKLLRIYERKVVFLMQESDISYTVEKELLDKKE